MEYEQKARQGRDTSLSIQEQRRHLDDLLSRGPEGEMRYVEVKGRASIGAVELSANEWLKAEQSLPI